MAEEIKKVLNLKALKKKDPEEKITNDNIIEIDTAVETANLIEKSPDTLAMSGVENNDIEELKELDPIIDIPKISLGLGSKKEENDETKEDKTVKKILKKEIIEVNEVDSSIITKPKISLGLGNKKEESDETKGSETAKKILKKEIIEEEFVRKKISLTDQLSKQADEKILQDQKDEDISQNLSSQLDEEKESDKKDAAKDIHFTNYESGFQKQSVNLIKKIQNFRYTPKTRTSLLIGLISLCVIIISGLMIFFPQKHSLSIYKASILEIYNSKTIEPIITPPVNTEEIIEQPIVTEEIIIEDTTLPETIIDEVISLEESNGIKKERLKNYLLNKYNEAP